MDVGLLAQYIMNGLMLGMMYALVAVGFTLFFGVLDVIKFSHGDVLTVGAFAALATYIGLRSAGIGSSPVILLVMLVVAIFAMAALGMLIARALVLPLRSAPALNTLLITLMLGTVLRESVRLFYPQGANPKPFPALLPTRVDQLRQFQPAARQRPDAGGRRAGHRRAAIPAQPHQARPRHPRGRAGRGNRAHHGHQFHRHRARSPSRSARRSPPSPA